MSPQKSDAHPDPARMTQPHELVAPEGEQNAGRGAMHDAVWKDHFRRQGQCDDDGDGDDVAKRNRNDGTRDRGHRFFLKA